jgi:hypothetical protein
MNSFQAALHALVEVARGTARDVREAGRIYVSVALRVTAVALPVCLLCVGGLLGGFSLLGLRDPRFHLFAITVTVACTLTLLIVWYPFIAVFTRASHVEEFRKWMPSARIFTSVAWSGLIAAVLIVALPVEDEPSLVIPIVVASAVLGGWGTKYTAEKLRRLILTKSIVTIALLTLLAFLPFTAAAAREWGELFDHHVASRLWAPERLLIGPTSENPVIRGDGSSYPFFLPTGRAQVWYFRLSDGGYELFTRGGTRPQGGVLELADSLEEVEAIAAWLQSERERLERAEADRIEAQRRAEAVRIEEQRRLEAAQRLERERVEAARLEEAARLAEAERVARERIVGAPGIPLRQDASHLSQRVRVLGQGELIWVEDTVRVSHQPNMAMVLQAVALEATQGRITVPAGDAVQVVAENDQGVIVSFRSGVEEFVGLMPSGALQRSLPAIEAWLHVTTGAGDQGFVPAHVAVPQ